MVFNENKPGIWTYENDEDFIIGVLLKIEHDVGPSKSMLYTLSVDEKPISVWGSTILDQRMLGIKVGGLIRITYKGLGEAKPGLNAPKIFKVELDDGIVEDKE